jgi:hypothetical protein
MGGGEGRDFYPADGGRQHADSDSTTLQQTARSYMHENIPSDAVTD